MPGQHGRAPEQPKGLVFDVQRYSIHDGPGIRTIVFLKGCPLRCTWCSNPESQSFHPEVEFRPSVCRQCGACVAACPIGAVSPDLGASAFDKVDRQKCDGCGRCADACPTGALRLVGRWMTVDEALAEALRDAEYFRRSGGGVTLSGGEPLMQPAFASGLLRACFERNVHTAVETTGAVPWQHLADALPWTDLFLYDLKHLDDAAHRRGTGVPNARILDNARQLVESGAHVVARVPLIPAHSLDFDHLERLAGFVSSLGVGEAHLMPYHKLGLDKYERLGRCYALAAEPGLLDTATGRAEVQRARSIFESHGLTTHVGG